MTGRHTADVARIPAAVSFFVLCVTYTHGGVVVSEHQTRRAPSHGRRPMWLGKSFASQKMRAENLEDVTARHPTRRQTGVPKMYDADRLRDCAQTLPCKPSLRNHISYPQGLGVCMPAGTHDLSPTPPSPPPEPA
eukprot:TRINITY_DN4563_c0_g1_i1.p4 TRINITY_DN4563_c0_g1~~TRINITY_DN4563_c0_g1_i1.p4  ORF type:complete len:135 (-),score=0.67 TRINITY_DN4563_c0_g1_i1:822-1226(-)